MLVLINQLTRTDQLNPAELPDKFNKNKINLGKTLAQCYHKRSQVRMGEILQRRKISYRRR